MTPAQFPESECLKTCSFSALKLYEQCPYAAHLKYIRRLPTPEPLESSPLIRGQRVHEYAENYIRGATETLHKSLEQLSQRFELLRELYGEGKVLVEEEWALTRELEPCAWNADDVWLRCKADAVILHDPLTATVIDLKTGRRFGNEIKHNQQAQLYAALAFFLFPNLTDITTQLWYADEKGLVAEKHIQRIKGQELFNKFIDKFRAMTSATRFPPRPNVMNCKWCDYGTQKGTGDCTFAVEPL